MPTFAKILFGVAIVSFVAAAAAGIATGSLIVAVPNGIAAVGMSLAYFAIRGVFGGDRQ